MIKGKGNRKRKCKSCDAKLPACDGYIVGVNFVCSKECGFELANKALQKGREKQLAKANKELARKQKEATAKHRERKKEVKLLKWWQDTLQALVNQFVMQVEKKGEPCVSCGNPNPTEAGHFLSRGAHPNKRYLVNNIFPQCHECNVYKSGNAGEYEKTLIARFGIEFVDDVKSYNVPLKEQFPHWKDYENEIKLYRKLLRENGVKPCR